MSVLSQVAPKHHRLPCKSCRRRVIEHGSKFLIESALDRHLEQPFYTWMTTPEKGRGSDDRERAKVELFVRIRRYSDTGKLIVPDQIRDLRDGLREFKAGTSRAVFYEGIHCTEILKHCSPQPTYCDMGLIRITHGFWKGTRRTPRKEIDRGKGIRGKDQANVTL